jgi:hypothetical protein
MRRYRLLGVAAAVSTVCGCASAITGTAVTAKNLEPVATLDGLYRVQALGTGDRNGQKVDDLLTADEQWAFRTDCTDGRCIATGAMVDAEDPGKPPREDEVVVADYVDG